MYPSLREFLPLHLYGKGDAKTVEDLDKEISEGETEIIWEPVRVVRVARLKVVYSDGEKDFEIYENRQVFADGRVRRRNIEGLCEKLKVNEQPNDGALRCLREELGLSDEAIKACKITHIATNNSLECESLSYPGLKSRYRFYEYIVVFPGKYWKPEFVEETKDGAKYYYCWMEVSNSEIDEGLKNR